ncbi:MAG: AAA family ATPase, partial [Pseudonocardiaceae bacterium]
RPLRLPTIPEGFPWEIYLPGGLLIIAIGLMIALPLMTGRSPHITVYPEQVEVGLTDVTGLNLQVDEVIRTLDVFLGYGTFRDELGGTPRRGILFEGPPGTGKTYLAKAMAKQAGVPFLFISASSMVSMFQGMTAYRIRSFFKALRKAARKEGGAIGFIEEIDAIAGSRDRMSSAAPAPAPMDRSVERFIGAAESGMVNELLIQMQSFDQPTLLHRLKDRLAEWINGYLPAGRRVRTRTPSYHNILLIAATNRGDVLDPALLRPGRFDRRLYFDLPTKGGRRDLIDYFLDLKSHSADLDDERNRETLAHDTLGYTPVMIEHLFDEALLVALKKGRDAMQLADVYEAKMAEEVGLAQPVLYTDGERRAIATHEAGHATVAYFLGTTRRLEILSIIKRRQSLGLLAHAD